ncbi:MAG: carboxypeptidase-like regulatory domain-containing protein [Planctomycetota bacterium]|jgi:hypothetical protein
MRKAYFIILLAPICLAANCITGQPLDCMLPTVSARVVVTLTDTQTSLPIEGATLTLTEGDYTEQMVSTGNGQYAGSYNSPGTYTLTVQANGYQDLTQDNIAASQSTTTCFPEPAQYNIAMTPTQ